FVRCLFGWTTAAVADVMKFVCERIFKFLGAHCWIQIKKYGRIVFHIKDETVFSRLNNWIDLSFYVSVSWQVSQRKGSCSADVRALPTGECFLKCLCAFTKLSGKHEGFEVRIFKGSLHRSLTCFESYVALGLKHSLPISFGSWFARFFL